MKVYTDAEYYCHWFDYEKVNRPKQADLIMFTGGEDITPDLYGQVANDKTKYNITRDLAEIRLFHLGLLSGKKMIGICRGAQFLTVMSGGSLIQHINNHSRVHRIKYYNDIYGDITSTHHQMMHPYLLPEDDYKLLAWAEGLSSVYEGSNKVRYKFNNHYEPEIVWYKKTNSLAIQGHPERMTNTKEVDKVRSILTKFMKDKL